MTMNHAITIGEVLGTAGVVSGLIVAVAAAALVLSIIASQFND